MIYYFDLFGTFVFAISGTITGIDRRLDLFGAAIIGLVTAVGGGSLRDILIGATPVGWMQDLNYLWAVALGIIISFTFQKLMRNWHRAFFLFDALGIGVFTVLGLEKAIALDLNPALAILLGMMSAVFGGVIRDVLCSQVPLILRKELYATICLFGGAVYVALSYLTGQSDVLLGAVIALIVLIRIAAVKYHLHLPVPAAKN